MQIFLYTSISIVTREAKEKNNLLAIDTMMPMLCPKGPIQHLMVIGTATKISFNPKLTKKAEMA